MTVKKIRFSDNEAKTKEKNKNDKLKFSREKLLDLRKKKTFKHNILPNLNQIKNEVKNFKKEREEWKNKIENPKTHPTPKILLTSKLTKTKGILNDSKYKSKKNKENYKNYGIKKMKRKNTKKLNEIEIIVLFQHLSSLMKRHKIDKISSILNKVKKKQIVQILNYFNIFNENTQAPIPLLKNILFNLLFNDLEIS